MEIEYPNPSSALRLCANLFHCYDQPANNLNTMNENEISRIVVDAAIKLHQDLGPGLLESVYEISLMHLLEKRGLACQRQVAIPINYDHIKFDEGFRADLVVNNLVIIELKSVSEISPVHRKQIQTYLRLSGKKLGLLLNFGAALMRDGIVRAVNQLPE
jgi:GxxExxY protein